MAPPDFTPADRDRDDDDDEDDGDDDDDPCCARIEEGADDSVDWGGDEEGAEEEVEGM